MRLQKIIISALMILIFLSTVFGQEKGDADQTLRGSGRVNSSTLAMEFDLPLGNYLGRGINVPISLSYSSKVWRMEYAGIEPRHGTGEGCNSRHVPWFAEDSASGWTTSLAVPYIEYTGKDTIYSPQGHPIVEDNCISSPPMPDYLHLVKRLVVHLPGGETHELRADANSTVSYINGQSPPANMWNATYYAADGSNIKYIEDSVAGTYKLLMPDGSVYDFASGFYNLNNKNVRRASKLTDRNGNYITYNNDTWTDTLGRALSAPIGLDEPSQPTAAGQPIEYSMPGMTGKYKFHWKQLKGSSAAESGLTDFNQSLRYRGSAYRESSPPYHWNTRSANTYLFASYGTDIVVGDIFNPIVLTEIELPTGQKYKFSYSVFGMIEKIEYPTGGVEKFVYEEIPTLSLSKPTSINDKTNLGVIDRKVLKTSNDIAPYQWTYDADRIEPKGYKVTINNPDGTKMERFLHRGNDSTPTSPGTFGYDNGLAGMSYEERAYDSSSVPRMVSKKIIHWTKTSYPIGGATADWHPRVTHEENHTYDSSGNGNEVWATTKYDYEDLSTIDKPLLRKKISEYAYQALSGSSRAPEFPGEDPDPDPTPIPTPVPPSLIRTSETTYLIYDTNISQTTRDIYKNQNMIGLATASVVKNSLDNVVSRNEMLYDESSYSPNAGRGNPTTSRVWDSSKGLSTNTNAYIQTRAKFDTYGNQYEAIDGKGNSTITTFDSTYHTFPVQVTSAIPDPTNVNGSNTEFITTATFDWVTGLPQTTTDANGLVSHIEYDPVTLRVKKTKTTYNGIPVGSESEKIYHDEPNNYWVKSKTLIDTNKWAESITYFDGLGRAYLSEKVNSEGNIFVKKEFDQDGRVLRVTNPYRSNETQIWTTNVYDEASRVKEVILPDGAKVKTDYGVSVSGTVGITKQITDQAGKKRKGITDSLGRMIRVIEDPGGQNLNTDYTFDTLGNLRKTVQGEQSRYFTHDSLGRLLYAKQPEQEANTAFSFTDSITNNSAWSIKYEYDDNGNITKMTNANDTSITATYDNLNRLKKRDYSETTPDVDFYYDGRGLPSIPNFSKGKTTRVSSSLSETRYTSFDNLGRLLTHEQRTTAGQLAETETPYQTAYIYNLSGALIEETYPSGRVVKNVLDNDGEMSMLLSKKNQTAGFFLYAGNVKYNSAGSVEKMRLGNGRWETASYNSRDQLTQIGLGTTDTAQDLLKLEYSYNTIGQTDDNNGNLRQQKITVPTVGQNQGFTAIQDYTYDDLNRIKSATETVSSQEKWKQTFDYDRYGNRRFNTANTSTLLQSNKTTNPLINTSDNRFQKDQDNDSINDYDYDKAGNLTLDPGGNQFIYDAENHQKEIKNSSNQTVGSYIYDGEGKRVKKITNTETTIFVYNGGGQLVAEYSTQTAQMPQVSYLTQDHLGSPRIITDQTGKVTTRKDYMAFGEETLSAERTAGLNYANQSETRKGYTGYEKDDESGLDFAQARYYNSGHGRFTSVDPLTASATIKNPQTFNRYSYVLNSPYKFTDPLGLLAYTTNSPGMCQAEYSSCDGQSVNGLVSMPDSTPVSESHSNEADNAPAVEVTSSGSPEEGAPTSDPPPTPPISSAEQNAETVSNINDTIPKKGWYMIYRVLKTVKPDGQLNSVTQATFEVYNDGKIVRSADVTISEEITHESSTTKRVRDDGTVTRLKTTSPIFDLDHTPEPEKSVSVIIDGKRKDLGDTQGFGAITDTETYNLFKDRDFQDKDTVKFTVKFNGKEVGSRTITSIASVDGAKITSGSFVPAKVK